MLTKWLLVFLSVIGVLCGFKLQATSLVICC